MSEELTQVLARAAGSTGARPDLGAVWSAGRARRRRARGLRAAAAVVVAAALAVGAVALASGGGDEDVVAGPQGGAGAVPPAEPEDVMVSAEVTTGRRSEGRPVVEPGEPLSVVYRGLVELFERGRLATWERWDGQGWVPEAGLIAGDRQPGGFRGGAVAPLEPPPTVPEDRRADGGPDTFPTPEDADPGWYRICVPMTGTRDTTVGGTVPAGAGPEVTAPPETVLTAGQPIEPCVQLRVLAPGAPTDPVVAAEPPPPEPADGPLSVDVPDPVRPGEDVGLTLATPGNPILGGYTTWEQWDGSAWVATHLIEDSVARRGGPYLFAFAGPVEVTIPTVGIAADQERTPLKAQVPAPDELLSPWSRVCVDDGGPVAERPCAAVTVAGAPEGVDPAFAGG